MCVPVVPPELPAAPGHVLLLVTSSSSLFVGIREPDCQATGLVTRYRGEGEGREERREGWIPDSQATGLVTIYRAEGGEVDGLIDKTEG